MKKNFTKKGISAIIKGNEDFKCSRCLQNIFLMRFSLSIHVITYLVVPIGYLYTSWYV